MGEFLKPYNYKPLYPDHSLGGSHLSDARGRGCRDGFRIMLWKSRMAGILGNSELGGVSGPERDKGGSGRRGPEPEYPTGFRCERSPEK